MQNGAVDPDSLGVAMADLLESAAPEGIRVRYSDGMLWYYNDFPGAYGGSDDPSRPSVGDYWRENLLIMSYEPPEEALRNVCEVTLDHFQDFVVEMTATPWPGASIPPRAAAILREDGTIDLLFQGDDGQETLVGKLAIR